MQIVEEHGDILREVEGRGFDIEVDRLVFGPWDRWSGETVAGLGFRLCHGRARCERSHHQRRKKGPTGDASANVGREWVIPVKVGI